MHEKTLIDFDSVINNSVAPLLQVAQRKTPQELFHYTSAQGLLGMLETDGLWATNINYLNDPEELIYGLNLLKSIFEANATEDMFTRSLHTILDIIIDQIIAGGKLQKLFSDIYLISFCEREDILGQWRLYGLNGKGYCIGLLYGKENFVIGPNRQEITPRETRFSLSEPTPVIYEKKIQYSLAKEVSDSLAECFKEFCLNKGINSKSDFAFSLANRAARFLVTKSALLFKRPEFVEEREWRVIIEFDDSSMIKKFRVRDETIIPYIQTQFWKINNRQTEVAEDIQIPLQKVVIGQRLHYPSALFGIKSLLTSYFENVEDFQISQSTIRFIRKQTNQN